MIIRRRRYKQTVPLAERLEEWAKGVREQADKLPPGPEREALIRKPANPTQHPTWMTGPTRPAYSRRLSSPVVSVSERCSASGAAMTLLKGTCACAVNYLSIEPSAKPPPEKKPAERQPSRSEEAMRVVKEYADDLREFLKKLRGKMH